MTKNKQLETETPIKWNRDVLDQILNLSETKPSEAKNELEKFDPQNFNALTWACHSKQDKTTIQKILDTGVDVNNHHETNDSAIHICYNNEDYELFDLLMKNGADINEPDVETGDTLVMITASYEPDGTGDLDFMLQYNPDVNALNSVGETALARACEDNNFDTAIKLLDHGANPYIENNFRQNIFDLAQSFKNGSYELLKSYEEKNKLKTNIDQSRYTERDNKEKQLDTYSSKTKKPFI